MVALPAVLVLVASPAPAQAPTADPAPGRWETGLVAAAGLLAVFTFDEPVQRFLQDHRSEPLDRLAATVRRFGEWPFYAGLPAALLAVGTLTGDARITSAGSDAAGAALATMGMVVALKRGLGRPRPQCECGVVTFEPLGGGRSLPSGHTAAAFAVASSLARQTREPWAQAGLYGAATLVGWSRLNDNRHWLSDVVVGALVGTLADRLANGPREARPAPRPSVHATSQGAALGWQLTF